MSTVRRPPVNDSAFVFWSCTKATTAPRSVALSANAGMPLSTRPARRSGPSLSPRTSSATIAARVRSGPDSPPIASRP